VPAARLFKAVLQGPALVFVHRFSFVQRHIWRWLPVTTPSTRLQWRMHTRTPPPRSVRAVANESWWPSSPGASPYCWRCVSCPKNEASAQNELSRLTPSAASSSPTLNACWQLLKPSHPDLPRFTFAPCPLPTLLRPSEAAGGPSSRRRRASSGAKTRGTKVARAARVRLKPRERGDSATAARQAAARRNQRPPATPAGR